MVSHSLIGAFSDNIDYYCPLKVKKREKIRADSIKGFSPFRLFLYMQKK